MNFLISSMSHLVQFQTSMMIDWFIALEAFSSNPSTRAFHPGRCVVLSSSSVGAPYIVVCYFSNSSWMLICWTALQSGTQLQTPMASGPTDFIYYILGSGGCFRSLKKAQALFELDWASFHDLSSNGLCVAEMQWHDRNNFTVGSFVLAPKELINSMLFYSKLSKSISSLKNDFIWTFPVSIISNQIKEFTSEHQSTYSCGNWGCVH